MAGRFFFTAHCVLAGSSGLTPDPVFRDRGPNAQEDFTDHSLDFLSSWLESPVSWQTIASEERGKSGGGEKNAGLEGRSSFSPSFPPCGGAEVWGGFTPERERERDCISAEQGLLVMNLGIWGYEKRLVWVPSQNITWLNIWGKTSYQIFHSKYNCLYILNANIYLHNCLFNIMPD